MTIQTRDLLPRLLGYLGLLPILASTMLMIFDPLHLMLWANILITYAVVILSFLGALHWAFAMVIKDLLITKRNEMFMWSVTPSLVAWIALFVPQTFGFLFLSFFFVFALVMDIKLAKLAHLPAWYIPMRLRLTMVVTFCLLTAAYLNKTGFI